MERTANNSLKGKTILITGASIGIGREDAYLFAEEGCRLAITYNTHKHEAEETAAKCLELGASDCLTVHLDIMDDESITRALRKVVFAFGRISILINNAGTVVWKHLGEQSFRDIEVQLRTNLEGLIKLTRLSLPHVREMIINIAGGAGLAGYEYLTTYCATKWGLRGFTKALAQELPGRKVYAVNPGVTATQMNDFQGMPPRRVAEVVVNLAKGMYDLESGDDVNIRDYIR
ncbi:MAG: SDR family NAD(P)-dependent oxidoreductase [Betaproteobacteria bacterium]